MGFKLRGDLVIPEKDFVDFAMKYSPVTNGNMSLGPPRIQKDGSFMVPFAINSTIHPKDEEDPPEWLVEKRPKIDRVRGSSEG
jgi:hypothetical protein